MCRTASALKTKRIADFTLGFIGFFLVLSGVFLYGLAVASIASSRADVSVETVSLGPAGATPALHLRVLPAAGTAAPGRQGTGSAAAPVAGSPYGTVVVVHGFAASKEFMRDLDYSLARAGFEVYGVDLPGHGRSGLRLDTRGLPAWFAELLASMRDAGRLANGPVYLVGHSLGTLVVTKGALDNPGLGVRAVVALSPVFSAITPTEPANYLVLTGEGELPGVKEAAYKALKLGTGLERPEFEKVYGDFAAGTARAAATVKGASHVSIADSRLAVADAIKWLRSAAGHPVPEKAPGTGGASGSSGAINLTEVSGELPRIESEKAERGFGAVGAGLLWLGLFYLGAGAAGLLGHAPKRSEAQAVVREARVAAGLPPTPPPLRSGVTEPPNEAVRKAREQATRLFAATRVVPILFALAAVVAALVPGLLGTFGFPRQMVTDYLTLYLLVFAAVLVPFLVFLGRLIQVGPLVSMRTRNGLLPAAALGVGLFALAYGIIGWFETFAWTNVLPPAPRWGQILLLALLFAPFAAVDELIRGTVHDRTGFTWGLFVATIGKLIMAATWYGAVLLPHRPQALLVVLPFVVGIFVVLDFAASLTYNEHGSWVTGAVLKALTLAWLAGTVFPLVAGAAAF